MKIYTKTGDNGTTSLPGGERVEKFDVRVEAYGTVDELIANIAMFRDMLVAHGGFGELTDELAVILPVLMNVTALLSLGQGKEHTVSDIPDSRIRELESNIDRISATLEHITGFTIPGGDILVSMAHICRTVCRRAERRAIEAASMHKIPCRALIYLNRLSDYFYVVSRQTVTKLNIKESLHVLHK